MTCLVLKEEETKEKEDTQKTGSRKILKIKIKKVKKMLFWNLILYLKRHFDKKPRSTLKMAPYNHGTY